MPYASRKEIKEWEEEQRSRVPERLRAERAWRKEQNEREEEREYIRGIDRRSPLENRSIEDPKYGR